MADDSENVNTPQEPTDDVTGDGMQAEDSSAKLSLDEIEQLLKDYTDDVYEEQHEVDTEMEAALAGEAKQPGEPPAAPEEAAQTDKQYADDDEGPEIPDEKIEEMRDMFKMIGTDEELQEMMNIHDVDKLPDDYVDSEIDKALRDDLEKDAQAADFVSDDVSFVKDVAVYDPSEKADAKIPVKKEKKGPSVFKQVMEALKTAPKYMYAVIGIVASLLIFLAVFLVALMRVSAPLGTTLIAQPAYTTNDSNFMFLDDKKNVGEVSVGVYKMMLSPCQTAFYLNEYLDVHAYNINVVDENGKVYFWDLGAMPGKTPPTRPGRTTLYMQPLDEGVRKFDLIISDPVNNEKAEFKYMLAQPLTYTPVKFAARKQTAQTNDLSAVIEHASFSADSSVVDFRIESALPLPKVIFVDKDESDGTYGVELTDGAYNTLPIAAPITGQIEDGSGALFGRARFEPVKSLKSNVNVTFNNLYESYDVNWQTSISALMSGGDAPYRAVLPAGRFNVYVERMMRSKDKFVLVLHAEDTTIAKPGAKTNPGETVAQVPAVAGEEDILYNRVEPHVSARIAATGRDGAAIEIEGSVKAAQIGADVIFDGFEFSEALSGVTNDEITLYIDTVSAKCPPATISLDLNQASATPNPLSRSHQNMIEESFMSRLAYKSGQISKGDIAGFSAALIVRQSLIDNYLPSESVDSPLYSAQVAAMTVDENHIEAIVKEIWQPSENALATNFCLTHKITASDKTGSWVIVTDEIIDGLPG